MNLAFVLLISLFTGAIINFLTDTLPQDTLRPVCTFCGETMAWKDYMRWWQPCSHCGKRRWRHGMVWVFMLVVGAGLWLYQPAWGFWPLWGLSVYALVVIVIDVEHHLILYEISAVGAVLGATLGVWRHGIASTLLGGLTGAGAMLLLYLIGNGYAAWKAAHTGAPHPEEPAMGFGDVTLMGALGLVLGWPGVFVGLTLGVFLGGLLGLLFLFYGLLRWRRLLTQAYIPYGPALVLGALLAILLAR